jgi:hypothetical protein
MTSALPCTISTMVGVSDQRSSTQACRPSHAGPSVESEYPEVADVPDGRFDAVEFEFPVEDGGPVAAGQNEFKIDFHKDMARLAAWAATQRWSALPISKLQVVVSNRYKISRSLVPAWSGHAGNMEFPAWRVIARKAAIAHELVHVFFPNGNRLLAEGLAVYLQAEIGGNPAFPNFGRPLHDLTHELLRGMVPGFSRADPSSLDPIDLAELDAIETPSPLTLRVGTDFYGEEPRGQAHIYPIAGSFVQFLIETRGLEVFRKLYDLTPLAPLQRNAGSPDRWVSVYGLQLAGLASEWKRLISSPFESTKK